MAEISDTARTAEAAVYVSMAGRRVDARIAEAAVYVSMAGERVGVRSAEAELYVSMACIYCAVLLNLALALLISPHWYTTYAPS
jgi:hypothetical protein